LVSIHGYYSCKAARTYFFLGGEISLKRFTGLAPVLGDWWTVLFFFCGDKFLFLWRLKLLFDRVHKKLDLTSENQKTRFSFLHLYYFRDNVQKLLFLPGKVKGWSRARTRHTWQMCDDCIPFWTDFWLYFLFRRWRIKIIHEVELYISSTNIKMFICTSQKS
jgi:hypothetical protein